MKLNNLIKKSHAKAESEMKIKKDEFAGYYNILREGYRQIKKLTSGWEIYLEDMNNK
jgi:predicted transcriptional regulator